MKIAITTVQVPFQTGGAALLCNQLASALQHAGHTTSVITAPFRFAPDTEIERAMDYWAGEDFQSINYIVPDIVIPLSFPTWGVQHYDKRIWMLHQHRAAYELYDESQMSAATQKHVHQFDSEHLQNATKIYTISSRVTERLQSSNHIASKPILHPPPNAGLIYQAEREPLPYIFFPSRIESLKRQSMAIEAMRYVKSPVNLLIAGMGGQYGACLELVRKLGLESRVRLLGEVTDADKRALYALCTGVLFPPFDEDYGYVTLEAMCAGKPVITCNDSGGVLEFVDHLENGLVVEPDAKELATAIDNLAKNTARAAKLGDCGRQRYQSLNLSWDRVVETLIA